MKKIIVETLFDNLTSNEIKDLRKQFNTLCSENMEKISRAEQAEIVKFIDGLILDRHSFEATHDVVSLNKWGLNTNQRSDLERISRTISQAFRELSELKRDIARDAKNRGVPYSKVFTTTVKRMNRFKANNCYGSDATRW